MWRFSLGSRKKGPVPVASKRVLAAVAPCVPQAGARSIRLTHTAARFKSQVRLQVVVVEGFVVGDVVLYGEKILFVQQDPGKIKALLVEAYSAERYMRTCTAHRTILTLPCALRTADGASPTPPRSTLLIYPTRPCNEVGHWGQYCRFT